MPKQKKGGRPGLYAEPKQHVSVGLTKTGISLLDRFAASASLSRSEVVEQLARQNLQTEAARCFLSLTEDEASGLRNLLALSQDELDEKGVFQGRKVDPDRRVILEQQIKLLKKLWGKLFLPEPTTEELLPIEPVVEALKTIAAKLMTKTSPKDLTPELQGFAEVVQWERCDQQVASALKILTAEERTYIRKSFYRLAAFIQFLEPQGLKTESGRRAFETLHRDLVLISLE